MSRQDFFEQLRAAGYDVQDVGGNHLAFQYTIPVGRLAGQTVRLGFAVSDDFPLNPPSGPHVSPQVLPIAQNSAPHPNGAIHPSDFGPEWEYWSRPHPAWATTDRSVKAYLAHIRHLFDTL